MLIIFVRARLVHSHLNAANGERKCCSQTQLTTELFQRGSLPKVDQFA
jgi:hypothetical protein